MIVNLGETTLVDQQLIGCFGVLGPSLSRFNGRILKVFDVPRQMDAVVHTGPRWPARSSPQRQADPSGVKKVTPIDGRKL